jgi:DNA-binding transcriptional MerR regulator
MAKEKKSSRRLLKTAEAATAGGVSLQSLQYYLMVGLVEATERTSAGHQLFDEKAIKRIRLIKQISDSGYPLREIREIFLQREKQRKS